MPTRIVAATNAKAAADATYATIANPNVLVVGWRLCIPNAGASVATAPPPIGAALAPATVETAANSATTQSAAPVATPEPLVPLAPGELHPLTIERMRQESYPGSDIVIEQVLDAGVNYDRYLASYLSAGNKIYAMLTVPRGEMPAAGWPVIVFNHGFIPPEIYRTTERYVAYLDAFARNGYIVLKSDYRGHGFSEGDATGGYATPAYTDDVLNAVSSIKRYPAADPNRIGMWGHSMGGQITLRAMVVTKDIKAGVIWGGVVASYPDLLERWRRRNNDTPPPTTSTNRSRRWRKELTEQFGAPEENPAFWASISPNSYLTDLSGPIQLHHSTLDESVPVELSQLLRDEIQAVNGTVEYYEYVGDNHNISANFNTAAARSVAFFDRYVKGVQ
ncbi:MAG: alpha/beta fold hydrolase [Caldilineaceae bacterium]